MAAGREVIDHCYFGAASPGPPPLVSCPLFVSAFRVLVHRAPVFLVCCSLSLVLFWVAWCI